jgi:protein-disulfide isomerase
MESTEPRLTKADRREAAREQARALREAQAKREKRNKLLIITGIVVLVTIIGVSVASILFQAGRPGLAGADAPAGADASGGIVVGVGGVGEPTAQAPEVRVYSDFICPFCGLFETTNGPMLEELRASGEATVIYHPVAFLDNFSNGTKYSTRAAQAAAVVADAAPERFTDFWLALFENQPPENTPGLSDDEIAALAVAVGVPQEVADTFVDGRFTRWVASASSQATDDLPRPATPTVLINGSLFEADWQDPENLRQAILDAGPAPAGVESQ